MKKEEKDTKERESLLYAVDEVPPVYLLIPLAVQQFLTCFGAVFSYPLLISTAICIADDQVGKGELINTVIFVCGISSILQTTFGVRLPIIQGASYAFITPVMVLMNSRDACPTFNDFANGTTTPFERGSDAHREVWQANLSEISGALMVASIVQVLIGFSGLIGLMVRYIGPLTIAPTISLIGLSLFGSASYKASSHWWITISTIVLITVFSQYLRNIHVPFFGGRKINIFSLFPVLLGIVLAWIICLILTESGALTDKKDGWGYLARTDIRSDAVEKAAWFRFPYPGQWGTPTVSIGGVCGLLAACVASMIESVGDYYACARLAGVSSPPGSAISRGIGMEGISCILAGAWGCGGGNTSYSENIGAIGITKVGSRVVVQVAGLLMIILGCVGKFGAIFVMMPDPVVGGLFMVMFGMVTAVGVSNLQYVDLNSTRNLFVFGFSTFFGLSAPQWVYAHPIDTGYETLDQVLNVLGGTSMLVGGVVAFLLDNTIPGTKEERGMHLWQKRVEDSEADWSCYNIPWIQSYLDKNKFVKYIPFCPGFIWDTRKGSDEAYTTDEKELEDISSEQVTTDQPKSQGSESKGFANASQNGLQNEGYVGDKMEIHF